MLCSFTELDMAVSFTCFSSFFPLSFFLLSHLPFSKQFCPISHCGPPTPSRDSIEIRFPFLNTTNPPECGLHTIKCRGSTPTVEFGPGRLYVIQSINYEDYTLVIKDDSLNHHSPSNFCDFLYNFKTPVSPFLEFKLKSPNYTFVSCKQGDHGGPLFNYSISYNHTKCGDRILYYGLGSPPPLDHQHDCSITWFPLSEEFHPNGSKKNDDLFSRLSLGFSLQWNFTEGCNECYQEKGGYCDRDPHTGKFTCPPLKYAKGKQGSSRKKSIVIGVILAVVVLIAIFLFLLIGSRYWWKKTGKASDAHNVEEFLKNYGSLALQRYTYSDLKKITYSFKDKLGQGGYGGVFKGMLLDGRLVAVKVLNESKGNGEEFINEVASIGRTYHVNVVALLGFCSEGSKRALIYEFMPNGSLEKFIYSEKPRQSQPLGWEKLCQIATGIARGLEYLHRGCNTRILHFDIKPHNILLDKGFCPKISDFGLAKLCPTQNSTISMLGARGTVGYIAPEVYCRNIGGVSYKSDVYSYGMMVLEMVGGRKNIDAFVENTSEIYFPHWIYKRLNTYKSIDLHGYLGLQGIETRIEEETARKMILVGLWCIQTNPLDRPSMSKVVEMLEGSVDGLQMPPQPFLSSSP